MALYDLINAHHNRSAGGKCREMKMARKKQYFRKLVWYFMC